MLPAIQNRRSIRKFKEQTVETPMIEEILRAGMLAPSSKNRQPWKFIVATGRAKDEAVQIMMDGLAREKECPFLPLSAKEWGGANYTCQIMQQAPVVLFVVNSLAEELHAALTPEERVYEICNAQSIGAAIENMTLTATELGLGSLWICDTFFAYEELSSWLGIGGVLYAALAIGYADEAPTARPRKSLDKVVEWRSEKSS